MQLRARELTYLTSGADVRQLHEELVRLGYGLTSEELDHQAFGQSTREAVRNFQKTHQLPVTGIVDSATAQNLDRELNEPSMEAAFIVRGTVTQPGGQALPGLEVSAFDRDLRSEESLGKASTNARGEYQISYSRRQFSRAEKISADLALRVASADGRMLFQSSLDETLFNAPRTATMDIRIPVDIQPVESEFEQLLRMVTPLLGRLRLAELREDEEARDISFLQRETDQPIERLEYLVLSQKLADVSKLDAAFFYTVLREDSLLKTDLGNTFRLRFHIGLSSDPQELLRNLALLNPDDIRQDVAKAIAEHIVPETLSRQLEAILQRLAAMAPEARIAQQQEQPRKLFSLLENTVSPDIAKGIQQFLATDFRGDMTQLLGHLNQLSSSLQDSDLSGAQTKLQLAELVAFDDDLIDGVRGALQIKDGEDLRKLAALDPSEWNRVLVQSAETIRVGGRPLDPKLVGLHASALAQKMERRFPTTAFMAHVSRNAEFQLPHREVILPLLEKHPDFDLASTNVDMFFRDRQELGDEETQSSIKNSIKALQRVFKLAPTFAKTRALLDAGFHSSQSICALSEPQFLAKLRSGSAPFTESEASALYQQAADIHSASVLLAADIKTLVHGKDIHALSGLIEPGKLEAITKDFPNLKTLFDSIDFCECKPCRSVYSPAAYLVDALEFLRTCQVMDTTTTPPFPGQALEALLKRRPDIGDLDLDCANTDTLIPYIDIVCELLENVVAPEAALLFTGALAEGAVASALGSFLAGHGFALTDQARLHAPYASGDGAYLLRDKGLVLKLSPDGSGKWFIRRLRQTHRSADELAAEPEYINRDAYDLLAKSSFAFGLPFDLDHQEAKAFFQQSGVDRSDLMEALNTPALGLQAPEIAAEALGLSAKERALIATSAPNAADQAAYWNFPAPASAKLKVVDTFLTKTGLGYHQLTGLLELGFIHPGASLPLVIVHEDGTCDTTRKHIENLDDAALDRIHRFLRLWKKLGWDMSALDRAISTQKLGKGQLDDACLVQLNRLIALSAKLGLPVDGVCAFFGELPRSEEEPVYQRIFLCKAANGTINEDFLPERVAENQKPATTPKKLLDDPGILETLSVALGLTQEDLSRLLEILPAPRILSFENLSSLYALATLARKLRLPIPEFRILQSLSGLDILAGPAETLAFIEQAAFVKEAGRRPSELDYILNHEADDLATRTLKESTITDLLTAIQGAMQGAFQETRSPFDISATSEDNRPYVKDWLGKLPGLNQGDIATFMVILDNTWSNPAQTPGEFLDACFLELFDTTVLKGLQSAIVAAATEATLETARKKFIGRLLLDLSTYFFGQAKEAILVKALADAFQASEALSTVLLRSARLKAPASAGSQTLFELLGTENWLDKVNVPPAPPAISAASYPYPYAAVRLFQKLALFASTLGLPDGEIQWLLENATALGWMELDRMPYQTGCASLPFSQWLEFQAALAWIKKFPALLNPDDPAHPWTFYSLLERVLAPAPVADIVDLLSRLAGWDGAVAQGLCTHFGFGIAAFKWPVTYARLEGGISLLRQLNLDLTTAKALCKPQLAKADVHPLRMALKARYDDAQWLGVMKNIQDGLRLQKRDALVAYILATHPGITSTSDLYDNFLIDVDMGAIQPTSRMVQAHGTVQLFAQRCLMGLEPSSVANVAADPHWERWKWMQNYRVWEANRKVFLYPENWIEPELRDDKSFLFSDLESEVAQGELSDRNVENATIRYLEKLDEIGLLEVVATYYQTSLLTMHVVARTKGGDPAMYYYRRYEQQYTNWTPWEKVELEITGDHVMVFLRNERLYLAWPLFSEEALENQDITIPSSNQDGTQSTKKIQKRWKIQLAISEYSEGKWLPKKVAKDGIRTSDFYEVPPRKEDFKFMPMDLGAFGFFVLCSFIQNGKPVDAQDWSEMECTSADSPYSYLGAFTLTGCKGYPEPVPGSAGAFANSFRLKYLPDFGETAFKNQRFQEIYVGTQEAGLEPDPLVEQLLPKQSWPLLSKTPGTFKITYPLQMSLLDMILVWFELLAKKQKRGASGKQMKAMMMAFPEYFVYLGTCMPYFYEDHDREYMVVPGFYPCLKHALAYGGSPRTFSEILPFVQRIVTLFWKYWAKLTQPNANREAIRTELQADPEFQDLMKLFAEYANLAHDFGYQFKNLYHPFVCRLRTALHTGGIPGLMKNETQMQQTPPERFSFDTTYLPTPVVKKHYPIEDIDFEKDGAYASYNWELFFHLPFEIAVRLNQDQRFEAAMDWFHYIFNPMGATSGTAPGKYWVTKPFHLYQSGPGKDYVSQRIDTILYQIASDPDGSTISNLAAAVAEWRDKPFRPHVVARSRPVAYQKAILIKYIQNLADWGDSLFRQDTMESVNQATQLYVLAGKILGPKPRTIPPAVEPPPETYNHLRPKLDLFGNALLDLENFIPLLHPHPVKTKKPYAPPPATIASLYFQIPQNEQLLQLWDLVEDRLFKIRNCMNIDGVERLLALFAPPIDPGALVRAAAAGLSISDILGGLSAPLPHYRFHVMARKASELTLEVRELGHALLDALEKKDAEGLALLRSKQERQLLDAMTQVKKLQITEAKDTVEALQAARAVWKETQDYYLGLEILNDWERLAEDLHTAAKDINYAVSVGHLLAAALKAIPNLTLGASGFGGSPAATADLPDFGTAAGYASSAASFIAQQLDKGAELAAEKGRDQRRKEAWEHQKRLVDREIDHVDKQIVAQQIRVSMAEKELEQHLASIASAKEMDDYLHSAYTNQELYQWMSAQVSAVYFKAYQLAFEVARKAERCFGYELNSDKTFLKAGYWENAKKGLLAANHLLHDLKRMEVAYLDQNKRHYELSKEISLGALDPLALVSLRMTGKCQIVLPESLFDLDHPGHYLRRLKHVRITIPCASAPHTTISAKLSLLTNAYRKNTSGGYAETSDDLRFAYNLGGIQSIATSTAQQDGGLFQLDFQDERYLPFEGTGAISTWLLELPGMFQQFDYETISDVVLHLQYTALDGGGAFRGRVESALKTQLNTAPLTQSQIGLFKAFDLQAEFPTAWSQLLTGTAATLQLAEANLPRFAQGHTPSISNALWLVKHRVNPPTCSLTFNGAAKTLPLVSEWNLYMGSLGNLSLDTPFTLSVANPSTVQEIALLVNYTLGS